MKNLVFLFLLLWICASKNSLALDLGAVAETLPVGELPDVADVGSVAGGAGVAGEEEKAGVVGTVPDLLAEIPVVGDVVETLDIVGSDEGDSGTLLEVPSVLDIAAYPDGRFRPPIDDSDLIGVDIIQGPDTLDLDKMNKTCEYDENGTCVVTEDGDVINIGLDLNKKNKYIFTRPKPIKFLIIRRYPSKTYQVKNVFGKGMPRPHDPTATCKDYAKCKKLRIFSTYQPIDSPYLYGTPYYNNKFGEGVTKQIYTQNFYAPGQVSPTYTVENNNQYLRMFKENLQQYCPLYDTCGSCNAEKFVDQIAVYTLDELSCDIFYTALRLFDIDQDKNNALAYTDLLISLDDIAGAHWFKLASDPPVAEQLLDTDRLQKLYELLIVLYGIVDENAYFILKQNYTSLCTPEKERCKPLKCTNDKYYTYDGTCNNPENSLLGKNPSSLLRIGRPYCTLDPARHCKLPGARTVSLTLGYISNFISYPSQPYYDIAKENGDYPSFLSLFGLFFTQFAMHDILQFQTRGVYATQQGGTRGCTRDGRHLPQGLVHPYSAPIDISNYDPYYSNFNNTCMEFVKAQKYNGECLVTDANIGNFASAYLDLSQLYPKNECNVKDYIAAGGKIKAAFGKFPYIADPRAYQTPLLTCITELFALLHNIIADNIKNYQSTLTDYEIFQKARLVNIYVYQYFYDNFVLPAILGKEYSNYQGITSAASCYDPKLDPTPLTEFSAAAGRYLHTYIPNKFNFLHPDYTIKSIQEHFKNYGGPTMAFTEFDACFLGMIYQPINVAGHAFQVQNWLFKFDHAYGADLFSFDVQRGRDTCIQPYIFYIKKFFGVEIKYWEDLSYYIPVEAILQLKQIYSDVCELELYTGISVEKKYEDGLFGPVGRKIITEQHLHSRCGDSKHYTNALDAVSKSCFSKINYNELFANLAGVKTTTKNILLSYSKQNRYYTIPEDAAPLEGVYCLIQSVLNKV